MNKYAGAGWVNNTDTLLIIKKQMNSTSKLETRQYFPRASILRGKNLLEIDVSSRLQNDIKNRKPLLVWNAGFQDLQDRLLNVLFSVPEVITFSLRI